MFVILHGEPMKGTSKGVPSFTETLLLELLNHLATKLEQCGENKRDRDAYNELLVAYKFLTIRE